jgi:hypothetical protein
VKRTVESGGKGQALLTSAGELHGVLEKLSPGELATYGLVLESNLREVTTLSVGHIVLDAISP